MSDTEIAQIKRENNPKSAAFAAASGRAGRRVALDLGEGLAKTQKLKDKWSE